MGIPPIAPGQPPPATPQEPAPGAAAAAAAAASAGASTSLPQGTDIKKIFSPLYLISCYMITNTCRGNFSLTTCHRDL